jgi:CheY-like chemotaxis protein
VIKVLIVNDHGHVRQGLGDVFAQTHDISVAAECADGREVVETALLTEPDVVLMDLALPGFTGLEATRNSLATRPDMRVVMLTGTVTVASVCQARKLGSPDTWASTTIPATWPRRSQPSPPATRCGLPQRLPTGPPATPLPPATRRPTDARSATVPGADHYGRSVDTVDHPWACPR